MYQVSMKQQKEIDAILAKIPLEDRPLVETFLKAKAKKAKAGESALRVRKVAAFLSEKGARASYSALGGVCGYPQRSIGQALGDRDEVAVWIVGKNSEMPSGYSLDKISELLGDRLTAYCTSSVLKEVSELHEWLIKNEYKED